LLTDRFEFFHFQPENGPSNTFRRNTIEQIVSSTTTTPDPLVNSSVSLSNGYHSESLIAREIRETKEKEEELKRQRKKCGFVEDGSTIMSNSINDSIKSESLSLTNQHVKSNSFLLNLDFFTSKANNSSNESTSTISSPRRSITSTQNLIFEPHSEFKQMNNVVSQELNRFNENGMSIIRTSSTNGLLHRSSSNQNILSTQNTNNIIQREIEAIRAKEAELRQLGRIQHTSDEHSDPRKYQECVPPLPKSYSSNALSTGKVRRDTERITRPVIATSNGFLQPKSTNQNSCKKSFMYTI